MSLTLVTPPAEWALSPFQLWHHMKVVDPDPDADQIPYDDALIEEYLKAAIARMDGKESLISRALITQTYDLKIDYCFPSYIKLPLPPLQQVVSVKYIDADGVEQTLDSSKYTIYGTDHGILEAAYGESWPTTRNVREAVTIRFTCGYGDNPSDVPGPIREAIALLTAHYYEHREAVIVGQMPNEYPLLFKEIVRNYRASWTF